MNDLFAERRVQPMLIADECDPFDDEGYIYELKVDGERCVAYLDPEQGTDLRNKRAIRLLPQVPELSELHRNVTRRCIFDGELAVITDGKPDFLAIQSRSVMTNPLKIRLASERMPACFVAFDILYLDDHPTNLLPLMERKALLAEVVKREDARFAVSRYIEREGKAFYELVKARELEGVVAKRRESRYYFGKRTKDWRKIKYLHDEDYVACGYARREGGMSSIAIGQYRDGQLVYKGRVSLGVGGESFRRIRQQPIMKAPPFAVPHERDAMVWIEPRLVCVVRYMTKGKSGGLRQAVFKGLREDKTPEECVEHI